MTEERVIIFGAGQFGHMALNEYGVKNVVYFIDNNSSLWDKTIEDIPIKKVTDVLMDLKKYKIIIASKNYELMEKQLLELGIGNYSFFKEVLSGYYMTDELIFNPYKGNAQRGLCEAEWIDNLKKNKVIETVNYQVEKLYQKNVLFNHVEIETINRCNGNCDFCPVSKKNEKRELKIMERKLFENIIMQLSQINYSGRLALFSNNEPFLDTDILDKHRYARETTQCKNAFIYKWNVADSGAF